MKERKKSISKYFQLLFQINFEYRGKAFSKTREAGEEKGGGHNVRPVVS